MTSAWTTRRQTVADALREAFEELEGGWSVYDQPTDVQSLPAVVLGPDDPYRRPLTFGLEQQEQRLIAHMFVNRALGNEALDRFDEAADTVITALDGIAESTRWESLRLTGEVLVGEQPALGASMQVSVL